MDDSIKPKLFHRSHHGFFARIRMLSNFQKELLRDKVNRKYKIRVEADQITNLILAKFECHLELQCGAKFIDIVGRVSQFCEFPLRIDFEKQPSDVDKCLNESLNLDGDDQTRLDLNLKCEIATKSRVLKHSVLSTLSSRLR